MRKLLILSAVAATPLAPAGAIANTSHPRHQTKQMHVTAQAPHGRVCEPTMDFLNPSISGWPSTSTMCGVPQGRF